MPVSTPSTRLPPAGKYTKKLKNLAAEAKKRAHDEKLAAVWKSISASGGSVDDGAMRF